MEIIVQIFTGGWHTANYTSDEIINQLAAVTEMIPLKAVIIGWNTDTQIYRAVGDFLHAKGIKMLLWLPVFSETGELYSSEPALDIFQNPVGNFVLQEGENFSFYCPSSETNIKNVFRIYETMFSDCGFDGVFLDKIRTQSFAAGVNGVLSCGCENCREIYEKGGLDMDRFRKIYEQKKDHLFDRNESGFTDPETELFFRIKSEIIAVSVQKICRYFKRKGMITGLDLYAPLLCMTVGQNPVLISKEADFIKPMLYRRTEAPAGIGFEYTRAKKLLSEAEGWPELSFGMDFLRSQLEEIRNVPCAKFPGIEVNYREDIARTDPDYIASSLAAFEACQMDGAVLSWDIMLAPQSHLEAVKTR